jgi:O-antigen ligase
VRDVRARARAGGLAAPNWLSQFPPGRLAGLLTGCWVSLYCLADFVLRPRSLDFVQTLETLRHPSPALAAAFLVLAAIGGVPMVLAAVSVNVDFRRVKLFFSLTLIICLSIVLSYIGATDMKDVGHLLLVAVTLGYLMVGAAANLDPERFLQGLGAGVALCQTAMLSIVLIDHDAQWGRLYGHNSSNYWGMTAQATIIACLAVRNRPLQILAAVIGLTTLVWCQTRGSMVAAGVGLLVAVGVLSLTKRLSAWVWLVGPAVLATIAIAGADFLSNKVMMLSDPNRGAASGLTGRVGVWRETLNLVYEHPLFGVGYRQHEQYLTSAASAHNAYLATIADVGLFGLMAYLLLVFGALAMAMAKAIKAPTPGRLMAVSYVSAYIVNGLFERNALNTGDLYSVLALVVCVWCWRIDDAGIRGVASGRRLALAACPT